jgi:hypothetical protein
MSIPLSSTLQLTQFSRSFDPSTNCTSSSLAFNIAMKNVLIIRGEPGDDEDFREHKPLKVRSLSSVKTAYKQLGIYKDQNIINALDGEGRFIEQIEAVIVALRALSNLNFEEHTDIRLYFVHAVGRFLIKPFDGDRRLLLSELARLFGKAASGERWAEKAEKLRENHDVRPVRSVVDGYE